MAVSDLNVIPAYVFAESGATIEVITTPVTVPAGKIMFYQPGDDQWWLATADPSPGSDSNSVTQPLANGYGTNLAISLTGAYAGQPLFIMTAGSWTPSGEADFLGHATPPVGVSCWLSTNAGNICPAQPIYVDVNPPEGTGSGIYNTFLGFTVPTSLSSPPVFLSPNVDLNISEFLANGYET